MFMWAFDITEPLDCPSCGARCERPFRAPGSAASGTELRLGGSLPDDALVPGDQWTVAVAADCPSCGRPIHAVATFDGRTLSAFGV